MDYHAAFAISKTGMALEQLRLEAATMNLAHVNVAARPGTEVYRAQHLVAREAVAFAGQYGQALQSLQGVQFVAEPATTATARLVLDPGHPDADASGHVAYPAINHNTEMLNLMTAVRAYEANVVALNAAKSMAQRALEIGGNS